MSTQCFTWKGFRLSRTTVGVPVFSLDSPQPGDEFCRCERRREAECPVHPHPDPPVSLRRKDKLMASLVNDLIEAGIRFTEA